MNNKTFVANIGDFYRHIELHRQRVFQLGMTLGTEKFTDLPLDRLATFLRMHDASKTMTAKIDLRLFNYYHPMSPLVRLFSFYGQGHETAEAKQVLKHAVDDINHIDQQVASNFFAVHREISEDIIEKFFLIEKVADLVDRSLDPVASEEFHQQLTPASKFIRDPEGAALSLWLEERYSTITRDLHMPRLTEYQKASGQ